MSAYETVAELVELRDPSGHRHFLPRGSELPAWVDDETANHLAATGDVQKFERI